MVVVVGSDVVLGQLADVGHLRHLLAGEPSGASSPQVGALHVGSRRELLGRYGRLGLDARREDAEVRDLHRLALEHQLADAVHHVGEHALDDTLGVGRVVFAHVLSQVLQRHGLAQYAFCSKR